MTIFDQHRIGILIKKPESIFSNGCVQQSLFLKQIIENTGFKVDFISIEPYYTKFEDTNIEINVIDDKSDLSNYKLFLFVSLTLNWETNANILNNIKRNNIKCVDLICGNLFILHQEEFVFNVHNIIKNYLQSYFDEYWILEIYPFMIEYMNLLTNKPTYITPYVWNNDVIDKYVNKHDIHISLDSLSNIDRSKVNIVIFEPNMSIHKTALIPLLIADKFYKENPNSLHKVYVFCGNKVIREHNFELISNLSIYKNGIIESYDRVIMPHVMNMIKNNNNFLSLVLSHNIMNELNFLHLELMHLNIPIIHNCKPFENNGLYYDDYSLNTAIDLIKKVQNEFVIDDFYTTSIKTIKDKYSPNSFENQVIYRKHIERLIGITINDLVKIDRENELKKTEMNKYDNLINNIQHLTNLIRKHDNVSKTTFYYNQGMVTFINNEQDIIGLKSTLKNLMELQNTIPLEIIYASCNIDKEMLIETCSPYKNKLNCPFEIEILDLVGEQEVNDTQTFSKHVNKYMSMLFSSFEKVLYIDPGVYFNKLPKTIMTNYNEKHLAYNGFVSCLNYKSIDGDELDILKSIYLKLFECDLDVKKHLIDTKVCMINKHNIYTLKYLGLICELHKIYPFNIENMTQIILMSIFGENENKELFAINNTCYMFGTYDKTFSGIGIYSGESQNDVDFFYFNNNLLQKNNYGNAKLSIDITDDIDVKKNKEDVFTFKGKASAKKLPKCIQL